jgi:hypothetical protein
MKSNELPGKPDSNAISYEKDHYALIKNKNAMPA